MSQDENRAPFFGVLQRVQDHAVVSGEPHTLGSQHGATMLTSIFRVLCHRDHACQAHRMSTLSVHHIAEWLVLGFAAPPPDPEILMACGSH